MFQNATPIPTGISIFIFFSSPKWSLCTNPVWQDEIEPRFFRERGEERGVVHGVASSGALEEVEKLETVEARSRTIEGLRGEVT